MKRRADPRDRPIDAAVGQRIRLRRKELKISLVTLAKEIGVSYQQMLKCEKGENRVSAGRLWRVAAFLQVPVSYFYGDVQDAANRAADNGPLPEIVTPSAVGLRVLRALDEIDDPQLKKHVAGLVEELAASAKLRKKT